MSKFPLETFHPIQTPNASYDDRIRAPSERKRPPPNFSLRRPRAEWLFPDASGLQPTGQSGGPVPITASSPQSVVTTVGQSGSPPGRHPHRGPGAPGPGPFVTLQEWQRWPWIPTNVPPDLRDRMPPPAREAARGTWVGLPGTHCTRIPPPIRTLVIPGFYAQRR